jgi:hypothetical protein
VQSVFQYPTAFTHMPFLVRWREKNTLLLSQKIPGSNIWRPAYTDWDDETDPIHPLRLNVPNSVCNLYGYVNDDDVLCVSFITQDADKKWRLYSTQARSWADVSPPVRRYSEPIWTGFISPNGIYTGEIQTLTQHVSPKREYRFSSFEAIFRVSGFNDKVLITAVVQDNFETYLFDPQTLAILQVTVPGEAEVYKSTLFDQYLVAARRLGEEPQPLEHRKLFYTAEYALTPTDVVTVTVV